MNNAYPIWLVDARVKSGAIGHGIGRALRAVALAVLHAWLLVVALDARAQEIPKAGVVERGLDSERQELEPEKRLPVLVPAAERQDDRAEGAAKIEVRDFRFTGNTVFGDAVLAELVAPYRGAMCTLAELREACDVVSRHYQVNGYFLARAYLPEQTIVDGIVRIEVREVRWGELRVQGNRHYDERFLRRHVETLRDQPVNYDDLLRRLLILDEYADLDVRAVFDRGAEPGTTDLVLAVTDRRPFHLSVQYNNFGSKYVSRDRFRMDVEYGNLVIQGDRIGIGGVVGSPIEALRYGYLDYELPVNAQGTRMRFFGSRSRFEVGREFRDLDVRGNSEIGGLELRHALVRSRRTGADVFAGFEYKSLENFVLSEETSNDELRILNVGVAGDRVDRFRGRNYGVLTLSQGLPNLLGGLPRKADHASRDGAGGAFLRSRADLTRVQRLANDVFLLLRGHAQFASDTLPSSEQLALGGYGTVRGYPQSKVLGDHGYWVSCELRTPPPLIANEEIPLIGKFCRDVLWLTAFVDHGCAVLKSPLASEHRYRRLTGVGCGLRLLLPRGLDVTFDYAWPLSTEDYAEERSPAAYVRISWQFF